MFASSLFSHGHIRGYVGAAVSTRIPVFLFFPWNNIPTVRRRTSGRVRPVADCILSSCCYCITINCFNKNIFTMCFCHHLISVVFSRLQSTDLSLSKNPTDMDETKQDPGLPSEVQWLIFTDLWKYAFVHWQTKMQLYSNVIFSNTESCMCAFEG